MAVLANIELRSSPRQVLTKCLPGPLLDLNLKTLTCKPLNISAEGLAVLSPVQLSVGAELTLKTHKDTIKLKVIWQKPDFGKQGLFRYGLQAIDPCIDLESLFRESSCLK
ncbi:MAG: PilZ domain-containing protein [Proteobacteria bacterium]|nr:PilZ domain-containing protein [Pseudomonadota bacterium]